MGQDTKFTPGPWSYSETDGAMWHECGMGASQSLATEEYHVEYLSVVGPNDEPIIQVLGPADDSIIGAEDPSYLVWPCSDQQAYANAHLISAAPELYEALSKAAESAGFQYMLSETRQEIEAALTKARGEQ
jgi:hypothetical protein